MMTKFFGKLIIYSTIFYFVASIPVGSRPLFSQLYSFTGKYSSSFYNFAGKNISKGSKFIIGKIWKDERSDSISRNYSAVRKKYKRTWNLETYSESERHQLMKLLSKSGNKK